MPRHQGLYWQQWFVCERCGFEYPLSSLQNQKGLLVCVEKCVDNLDVEYRPLAIQTVLADTQETENEYEHVTDDPQDIQF